MHTNHHARRLAIATLAAFSLASTAEAADVFFGEDINWTATGQNENATRIPHPNSDAARASFLSQLADPVTESFESYAPNASISTLTFGLDAATLSPALSVMNSPTGTLNGAYPISGNKFLLQNALGASTFSITFNTPQSAFGFYVTDLEVRGNLSLRFLLADGVTTVDRPVPSMVGALPTDNNTGSVAYWGIVDAAAPFTRVTFIRNLNAADGFGFDDMTIARPAQVVPEPTSFALWCAGISALVFTIRRRRVIALVR